ncbi:mitogen-activated protein kinase kinase kinase 15-like isoform X4 [Branchiostoma floridae x Branchiostoma japonicum]
MAELDSPGSQREVPGNTEPQQQQQHDREKPPRLRHRSSSQRGLAVGDSMGKSLRVVCVTGNGNSPAVCAQAVRELERACASQETASTIHSLNGDGSGLASPTTGGIHVEKISFERLDFGETKELDLFYTAEVAVVDVTPQNQQAALFYHLGVRESFGCNDNIVLYYETGDPEVAQSLKASCSYYTFIPYMTNERGRCYVSEPMVLLRAGGNVDTSPQGAGAGQGVCVFLSTVLKRELKELARKKRTQAKDLLLNQLRKARSKHQGHALAKELATLRGRLDDPTLLSGDIVHNFLLSYRECQDYNAMVKLYEDLQAIPYLNITDCPSIQHLYAFALNRRNRPGDREKALDIITQSLLALVKHKTNVSFGTKKVTAEQLKEAIENSDVPAPDLLCMCGRIYKDLFLESECTNMEARENAIHWYRKGFEVQPNTYAGINLATLLVVSGQDFLKSPELQRVGVILNNLVGRKGSLPSLEDYWDVATFFEISALAQDYSKAIQAAEQMYKLKPPTWYLKSTLANIKLQDRFRKDKKMSRERTLFEFWVEVFVEATKEEESNDVRFPVLLLEPTKLFMPSFVTVNTDSSEKSVHLWHVAPPPDSKELHDWKFSAASIKSISLYKRDDRCVFMYIQENLDDFQLFFPADHLRQRFYHLVTSMTEESPEKEEADNGPDLLQYEYEFEDNGNRVVLGKGTFGVVYAARDLNTQVRIAIKEVPERDSSQAELLHEEIRLHSRLSHKNIVKYLGSVSEDGVIKIFMELVPGGSLSSLLRQKWGPLKENENAIIFYTRQILEGLKYLHDNKIVHRDIKGDNCLVNTYSGVVKISDFGTSKRLAGINPCTDTFTDGEYEFEEPTDYRYVAAVAAKKMLTPGTLQYMAPEVIDRGLRGHGPPADIWSLGCTIVEMATGKPPFIELGNPQAAMFKVGYYKIHPDIPDVMSDKANSFLLRCFEADPGKRSTAGDLLTDPWLNRKKSKVSKSKSPHGPGFDRSISVCERRGSGPITWARSSSSDECHEVGSYDKRRSSMIEVPRKLSYSPGDVHPSPPVIERHRLSLDLPSVMEHPNGMHRCDTFAGSSSDFGYGSSPTSISHLRTPSPLHSSSDGSTDAMDRPRFFQDENTASGLTPFYNLRKESERRSTLVKVLEEDEDKVCASWLLRIEQDSATSVRLSKTHLVYLIESLRQYIKDQVGSILAKAIGTMKQQLEFDSQAMNEVQIALYIFQDVVFDLLKEHNIQPHWMFALDDLVRNAVQLAITYIPDYANRAPPTSAAAAAAAPVPPHPHPHPQHHPQHHQPDGAMAPSSEEEGGNTSGVSTLSSTRSHDHHLLFANQATQLALHEQVSRLQLENRRLLEELMQSERQYNELLHMQVVDRQQMVRHLQSGASGERSRHSSAGSASVSVTSVGRAVRRDAELDRWLTDLGLDTTVADRFFDEEYSLHDVLELMTRDDLRQLNLRGGIQLRIWDAVLKHRTGRASPEEKPGDPD